MTAPYILRGGAPKKIAIALSGGVDSSVVAYLMKQANSSRQHELLAIHMSNWNTNDEEDPYCTKERDWKDAQAVAKQLNLPLHPTSFAAEYWTQVFEPFTEGVEQGTRPNPDVKCNRYIKFGALKEYVHTTLQADVLATGHYARLWNRSGNALFTTDDTHDNNPHQDLIEEMLQQDPDPPTWIRTWGDKSSNNNGTQLTPLLLAARDRTKCQSFFLSSVPGSAFQNVVFPLGDLLKKKKNPTRRQDDVRLNDTMTVREIAEFANLSTARKKDSMGICFIGKRPGGFTDFIDQYFPVDTSFSYQFVDVDTGAIVANEHGTSTTHHMVYTRGQRAKISGASVAWFVVRTDKESKSIWVCQGTHHPALYTDTIYMKAIHWVAGEPPPPLLLTHVLHAKCRVRNLQPLVDCQITYDPDSQQYIVQTQKPLRAVTPGQHCALYVGADGLVCLGGGEVQERGPSYHELGKEMPSTGDLHPSGHNDLSVLPKQAKT
ncbi:specific 2-thiouridylase MnmA [Seminavis robusta]|uniref:tRNA-5-taurinomethyluridine 2-sulfurtransferase n=1 Tax=Seminavis robusta TaxID=568900 RepID=A0A9N8H370_9STRA|nr:specific 2-thiouridylase MnmA [Seminavis robusta]|eukprot:Sro82_g043730.1 specific 2-thiouridylase MnmA (489) ;mRNA; f:22262-23728